MSQILDVGKEDEVNKREREGGRGREGEGGRGREGEREPTHGDIGQFVNTPVCMDSEEVCSHIVHPSQHQVGTNFTTIATE